jgi:cytosine/uracil/thiamine/allantoin permease
MKRYQTGEVTLLVIVMVGMMVWMLSSRHMGMMGMGHTAGHDEKPAATGQQTKSEPPVPATPEQSTAHQH